MLGAATRHVLSSLLLIGLAGCDTISWRGLLGMKQGVLVVAPGLQLPEVQRQSSLPLSSIWKSPDGSRWATTKEIPLLFDARIAGTALHFERCVYHVVETRRAGDLRVRRVQLDLEPLAWNEAHTQLLATQRQLRDDSWQLTAHGDMHASAAGSLLDGIALGHWTKHDIQLQFYVLRDFHSDDHARPEDVRWQQEIILLSSED